MITVSVKSLSGFIKSAALAIPIFTIGGLVGANAQNNELGKQLYAEACATCHGNNGLGDGEFAQYLNVKPSNLAMIAKNREDKQFPYLDVFMVIDGRTGVRGHGGGDMPIWGQVFARDTDGGGGPYGKELLVRARLVALVDYIESLQVE